MFLVLLTAACMAGTVSTLALWASGWNSVPLPNERLNRLRSESNAPSNPLASILSLRRRAGSIQLGGLKLVNGDIAGRWAKDLERAGLTLHVREFFIMRCTVALVFLALAFLLSPIKPLALVAAPLGYFVVGIWLKRRINKRQQKLESQLVELLQMLASGLRAGFGLLQALEASTEQMQAPLSIELRRLMRDTAMGSSVEASLNALNERVGSRDYDIVITAILIQRSVGGNLAEILDTVANTMRERERIKGEIRTLTSQQRMTGYVIGGLPIGLAIILLLINPEFSSLLYTEKLGQIMLGIGAVMWGIGFMIIQKIVNIEV